MNKQIIPELSQSNFFRDHWPQIKSRYSPEEWRYGVSKESFSLMEIFLCHWETNSFAKKNPDTFLGVFKELIQTGYVDPLLPQIRIKNAKEPLNVVQFLWEAHNSPSLLSNNTAWLSTSSSNKIGGKMLMECLIEGCDIDNDWVFTEESFTRVVRTNNLELIKMYVDKVKEQAHSSVQDWNLFSIIVLHFSFNPFNTGNDLVTALDLVKALLPSEARVSGFESLLSLLDLNPAFALEYDQWLSDQKELFDYEVDEEKLSAIRQRLSNFLNLRKLETSFVDVLSRITNQFNRRLSAEQKEKIVPSFSMEYRSFSKKWRDHWLGMSIKKHDFKKMESTVVKSIFNLEFFLTLHKQLGTQRLESKPFESPTVLSLLMLLSGQRSLSQTSSGQSRVSDEVQKSFLNAFQLAITLEKPKFNRVPVATSNVSFNMNKWFDAEYAVEIRRVLGSQLSSTVDSSLIQNLLNPEEKLEFARWIEINRLYEQVKKIKKSPEPKPVVASPSLNRF